MDSPIQIDPEIMSGTPCFAGTRVPVRILFEFLEAGDTIDSFRQGFPTARKEQMGAVLELAKERLLTIPGSLVSSRA